MTKKAVKRVKKTWWIIRNGSPTEVKEVRFPEGPRAYIHKGRGTWAPIFKTEIFSSMAAAITSQKPKTIYVLDEQDVVECTQVSNNVPIRVDTGTELRHYGWRDHVFPTRRAAINELVKTTTAALEEQKRNLAHYTKDNKRALAMLAADRKGRKAKAEKVMRPGVPVRRVFKKHPRARARQ